MGVCLLASLQEVYYGPHSVFKEGRMDDQKIMMEHYHQVAGGDSWYGGNNFKASNQYIMATNTAVAEGI